MLMGTIFTLTNQKGGVGKTTTAINVGAYLAAQGRKVLLVDVDPQANATSSLGVNKNHLPLSIYDSLIRGLPLARVILPTEWLQLDLAPSAPSLAGARVELTHLPARERLLRLALRSLEGRYDYIIIDPPPSLGLLTVNALVAARDVIIPVQCEYLSLEGLTHLLHTIGLVRRALNPALHLFGLVMTMYDARTNLARQVVEEVRRHFPEKVFRTIIPRSVRLSEAPSYGEPISIYAPRSAGALAYEALTREILERVSKREAKVKERVI
jgi:chromosome partitioning protein